jgi:hypothetical protein
MTAMTDRLIPIRERASQSGVSRDTIRERAQSPASVATRLLESLPR